MFVCPIFPAMLAVEVKDASFPFQPCFFSDLEFLKKSRSLKPSVCAPQNPHTIGSVAQVLYPLLSGPL